MTDDQVSSSHERVPNADSNALGSDEESQLEPQVAAELEGLDLENKVDFVGDLPSEIKPQSSGDDLAFELKQADTQAPTAASDLENERSPQRLSVELRRIEGEVRAILESNDTKRKRRLTGTHRWDELLEDIISWEFTGRYDESQLRKVRELIVERNHLFDHLRFLASTRPTWNS